MVKIDDVMVLVKRIHALSHYSDKYVSVEISTNNEVIVTMKDDNDKFCFFESFGIAPGRSTEVDGKLFSKCRDAINGLMKEAGLEF